MQNPAADSAEATKLDMTTILCPNNSLYVHSAMLANLKPLYPFSLRIIWLAGGYNASVIYPLIEKNVRLAPQNFF
jgi:hypothetical protein